MAIHNTGSALGPITAAGQSVVLQVARATLVGICITAPAVVATFLVEGSVNSTDGVDGDWFTIAVAASNATNLYTQVASIVLTAKPTIAWQARCTQFSWVRVRASAWTSGTNVAVTISGYHSGM